MVNISTVASPHSTGSPAGLQFENRFCFATTRVAVAPGEIVMFDILNDDGDVNDNDIGQSDSGLTNVIRPAATGLPGNFFGIALETAAADTTVKVLVQGYYATALTDGGVSQGDLLVATAASHALDTLNSTSSTALNKIIAVALEDDTSTAAPVVFDGINGISTAVNITS